MSETGRMADAAQGFLDELRGVVGADHLLTEPDVVAGYSRDWTGRFVGRAQAVVRPGTAAEVAAVLSVCSGVGVAVVPQGGNTGLVGGSVPLQGEVVLSLTRICDVEVDELAAQVTAGAGAPLAHVQRAARQIGWEYGIDLAARDSATVGGMVATNAGGVHVLRHGDTRRQVVGYEAVTAGGAVLSHLSGLLKDNTGYDLGGLLCGSEGTLAVLTRVRLRLVPRAAHRATALLGFDRVRNAFDAIASVRAAGDLINAVEVFMRSGLELVVDQFALRDPMTAEHVAYLLVEAADTIDPTAALGEAVDGAGADEVAVAVDGPARATLWELRERHTEAISRLGPPVKLDVTLPANRLAAFSEDVPRLLAAHHPDARTWLFGHAGDGNIHVNVTGYRPGTEDDVTELVLSAVTELGGSISAEHGIGTAKRAYLHLCRSDAEIAIFRAIKAALDPNGILNPHVLLPE